MNFFKNYLAYLKDNPNRYWFKRKLYGYGWVPARKEGWLTVWVYVLFVTVLAFRVEGFTSAHEVLLQITLPVGILTLILLIICYKKGEKPRWQWGRGK